MPAISMWMALACSSATDSAAPAPLPDGVAFVVADNTAVRVHAEDGSPIASLTWATIAPEHCGTPGTCQGYGTGSDGAQLLGTWDGPDSGGFVGLSLEGDALSIDWTAEGFAFPHDIAADPLSRSVLVAETGRERLLWFDPVTHLVSAKLGMGVSTWGPRRAPNATEIYESDGRVYLLVTNRLTQEFEGEPAGSVTLWDVTEPHRAQELWVFPETGHLYTPHGGRLAQVDGQWWLMIAHSRGFDNEGSISLAATDDLDVVPAYHADLALPAPGLAYPRGVDLRGEHLWITDAGRFDDPSGVVYRTELPDTAPSGLTGAYEEGLAQQVRIELDDPQPILEDLDFPFDGWWWTTAPLDGP